MTGQEVKRKLWSQGSNLKEWALANGYSPRLVSDVVRGVNRANYGKGYEIAVKLGIKQRGDE
jgi:gp16 family phage-associated protein